MRLKQINWYQGPFTPGWRTIVLYMAYLLLMDVLYLDAYIQLRQHWGESRVEWIVDLSKNVNFMAHFLVLWGLLTGRAYGRYLIFAWFTAQCTIAGCGLIYSEYGFIFKQALYFSIPPLSGKAFDGGELGVAFAFFLSVNLMGLISVWLVLFPHKSLNLQGYKRYRGTPNE